MAYQGFKEKPILGVGLTLHRASLGGGQ